MNLKLMVQTDCYVTTYCVYQYYLCFLLILMIMFILCWNPSNVIRSYTVVCTVGRLQTVHTHVTLVILSYTKYPTKSTNKQKHNCPRLSYSRVFTIDGKVASTVYKRVIFEKRIKYINAYFTRAKYVILVREKLDQTSTQCFH